jgi:hypothetical protein
VRTLAKELGNQGFKVGKSRVATLLAELGYSLIDNQIFFFINKKKNNVYLHFF